jgi:hypothetical protein
MNTVTFFCQKWQLKYTTTIHIFRDGQKSVLEGGLLIRLMQEVSINEN